MCCRINLGPLPNTFMIYIENKSQHKPTTIIYCHAVTVLCVLSVSTHMVSIRSVRVEGSELEANDVSKQHQKVVGSACIKLLKI